MLKLNWQPGRQNSGYLKLKLLGMFNFDLYILKYPPESFLKPHRDPVEGKRHHRINWTFWRAPGAYFYIRRKNGMLVFDRMMPRIFKFRPDIETHFVLNGTEGTSYALSLGWVTKMV